MSALSNIYRTASRASPIASSDQGVGFDLDNSIPSLLHRPYNVPIKNIRLVLQKTLM